jgi:hypothetical protein
MKTAEPQKSLRTQFEPMLLSPFGFHADPEACRAAWVGADGGWLAAQLARAMVWLFRCTKTEAINRAATSYGLKHLAEDYHAARGAPDGGYISNGVFLMAASRLGFQIEPIPATPNAWLNLSPPASAAHDSRRLADDAR